MGIGHQWTIKEWHLSCLSNYVSITKIIITATCYYHLWHLLITVWAKEMTGNGGVSTYTNDQGHVQAVNPIVKFFHEL